MASNKIPKPPCSVESCAELAHARGWCANHYSIWRTSGDPLKRARKVRGTRSPDCVVEGCDLPGDAAKQMCERHYKLTLRNGSPHPKPGYESMKGSRVRRPLTPEELTLMGDRLQNSPKRPPLSEEARKAKDREYKRVKAAEYRAKDPEGTRQKRREHMAKYGPEYRHKWNHYNRLRRLEKNTPDEWSNEYAMILRGDPCCYCGKKMEHIDHIQPLALGGDGAWDNLTAACADCNLRKNAKSLLSFLMDNPIGGAA